MATISLFLPQMPVAEIQQGFKSGAITCGVIATVGIADALARRIFPRIMEPKNYIHRASLALSLGISLAEALQFLEERVGGTDRIAIGAGMVAGIIINHRPFSATESVFTAYVSSAAIGGLMTASIAWLSTGLCSQITPC